MPARLKLHRGASTPTECELDPERPVLIGRRNSNDLVVKSQYVSRKQATIYHQDQDKQWYVEDYGGKNATRLNKQKISKETYPLKHGDLIEVGETGWHFLNWDEDSDFDTPEVQPAKQSDPTPDPPEDEDSEASPTMGESSDSSSSLVQMLDSKALFTLFRFSSEMQSRTTLSQVIKLALQTVWDALSPTLTGFLGPEDEKSSSKLLLSMPEASEEPVHSQGDVAQMSERLTKLVRNKERMVWLAQEPGELEGAESLLGFTDAIGAPVRIDQDHVLGALHVYRRGKIFTPPEAEFCSELAEALGERVQELRRQQALQSDNSKLREITSSTKDRPRKIIGGGKKIQELRKKVGKLAKIPAAESVLIYGETGSGKELAARLLHQSSARSEGPFVCVNSAAITEGLFGSMFFGHKEGAFTGATEDREGFFS